MIQPNRTYIIIRRVCVSVGVVSRFNNFQQFSGFLLIFPYFTRRASRPPKAAHMRVQLKYNLPNELKCKRSRKNRQNTTQHKTKRYKKNLAFVHQPPHLRIEKIRFHSGITTVNLAIRIRLLSARVSIDLMTLPNNVNM